MHCTDGVSKSSTVLSPSWENLKKKEGNFIKPINNKEAEVLRNNNMAKYVIGGHGTYRRKLVVEKESVLEFLEKYRLSIKVK